MHSFRTEPIRPPKVSRRDLRATDRLLDRVTASLSASRAERRMAESGRVGIARLAEYMAVLDGTAPEIIE